MGETYDEAVPLSVVIAPDSFKGSLSARDAAAAIARGWSSVRPDDAITLLPQADGGEGTLDAIETAVPVATRQWVLGVTGPDGALVDASWLALPDGTAVVELAQSSGLPLMRKLDPLGATTRGLGEVIRAALATRPSRLLVGLGGSASTEGGSGVLDVVPLVDLEVVLLTDVNAPLLGPTGAAAVFSPQKGASPAEVIKLEARLEAMARRLGGDPSAPGSGAAGGTAYGLATAWGATIASGADHIAAVTGLDAALTGADAVVTGEGRFDAQSLTGKTVGRVLAAAARHAVPAALLAGSVEAAFPGRSTSLSALAGSPELAMQEPGRWLETAGADAAQSVELWASRNS